MKVGLPFMKIFVIEHGVLIKYWVSYVSCMNNKDFFLLKFLIF